MVMILRLLPHYFYVDECHDVASNATKPKGDDKEKKKNDLEVNFFIALTINDECFMFTQNLGMGGCEMNID